MVHKNRSSRKSCPVMDVSPLRHSLTASVNKYELSSSPRIGYKLEVPTRPLGSSGSSSNQWHYNNMIMNNRQEFNNLHFC
ncbi:uncharacterized protein LOC111680200 [Lucilia cuprina]|uniref:uncharacterized protein LOC111680200 n=1 Tax=Lucilia cuprina TaxID=7375 RepID=UPI000C71AA61|nr:uncharacterized protein LOC111680200 [Lucilia cuprina]